MTEDIPQTNDTKPVDSATNLTNPTEQDPPPAAIACDITAEAFDQWYRHREIARNIKEGTPYFNGPNPVKPPSKHSPSDLLQCSRKIAYKQQNAPEETADPAGIFWFGSHFEEDLILPFLSDLAGSYDAYVTNSLWVDFTVETPARELQLKGATDPVIVDRDSQPLLLTEVKTKQSIENLSSPNQHHLAQTTAYMYGLTQEYDRPVSDAVILYGSRTTLDVKPFHVEFDDSFWNDIVLEWAANHTTYRLNDELPPASPQYDWECSVCPYQDRCGEGSRAHANTPPHGLLPLYVEYPKAKLQEYLEAHQDAHLTPSLAHHYPALANEYSVLDWHCEVCGATHRWNAPDWDGNVRSPPACPDCSDDDLLGRLTGPSPTDQPLGDHQ